MTDPSRPDGRGATPVVVNPGMITKPPREPRLRGPSSAGYVAAAVVGIVLGAVGLAVATGMLGGLGGAPAPTQAPSATPSPSPAGNSIGSPDAPVTIEVWADYQCPYCRLEDLLFGGAVGREYVTPGIVRVTYRDFAFLGQESIDAAVAARCAGRQDPDAQLRFRDALYTFQQGENQGRFVRDNLLQIASIAGVPDESAFKACLDDATVAQEVADETATGRALGISSTPMMRLVGPGGERVLTGFSQTWATLRDAIEAVRVEAPSPGPTTSSGPSVTPRPSASPAASGTPPSQPAPGRTATPTPSATPGATTRPSVAPGATPTPGASPTPGTTPAPSAGSSPSAIVTP
jgi:protein-disulfide isomerase